MARVVLLANGALLVLPEGADCRVLARIQDPPLPEGAGIGRTALGHAIDARELAQLYDKRAQDLRDAACAFEEAD